MTEPSGEAVSLVLLIWGACTHQHGAVHTGFGSFASMVCICLHILDVTDLRVGSAFCPISAFQLGVSPLRASPARGKG